MPPEISVIIPTRGRPEKIGACLARLAAQDLGPERLEVLVGLDGPDGESEAACARAWSEGAGKARLEVVGGAQAGLAAARNRLMPLARGRYLLSLNDDVLAEPGLCRAHVEAHRRRETLDKGPATVVGDAPWVVREPDRLFDRLLRQTSMIFFYDQMPGARDCPGPRGGAAAPPEPERDWGFRHAFGLNVSYPAALVREVGGFAVYPEKYGFEDTEIAWRLAERFGMPVVFERRAVAWHDHAYEPRQYLEREHRLGLAAWGFAGQSPECARALFGRDIRAAAEVAYSREYVERERGAAARARETFERLADVPAGAIDGPHAATLLSALYQQHLPLKRWEWRRGLVEAAEGNQ